MIDNIENIVFDFNGTIASGGKVSDKVKEKIIKLTEKYNIFIVTGDIFGTVREFFLKTQVEVVIVEKGNEGESKLNYIKKIGCENTIALGNGNNDMEMIKCAKIGIALLSDEGVATKTLLNSDIVIKDINDFFEMIDKPTKLKATLKK